MGTIEDDPSPALLEAEEAVAAFLKTRENDVPDPDSPLNRWLDRISRGEEEHEP